MTSLDKNGMEIMVAGKKVIFNNQQWWFKFYRTHENRLFVGGNSHLGSTGTLQYSNVGFGFNS